MMLGPLELPSPSQGVFLGPASVSMPLKVHNTLTQFYLKDVAWVDSELYHLGPVVAAQQVHK